MIAAKDLVKRVEFSVGEQLADRDRIDEAAGSQRMDSGTRRQFAQSLAQKELAAISTERLQTSLAGLSVEEEQHIIRTAIDSLFGLGLLQQYIDDPRWSDIYVNGYDNVWLVTPDGQKFPGEPVADSDEHLIAMVKGAARRSALAERQWDFANPTLDLNLPGGARLNALGWVVTRPSISIRRHNYDINRLKQLVGSTLSHSLFEFCKAAMASRMNMLVSAGTGVGKTTFLRCLINEIPPEERLVTIEDSLELALSHFSDLHPDLLETEARQANMEGEGAIGMHDLVRNTLRMKPDRVIVGEIRGNEVLPMLLAMSQGNDGSLSTVHADSSSQVFDRLRLYMSMTEQGFSAAQTNMLVANSIDFIIQLRKLDDGKTRVIESIREVRGATEQNVDSNEIFAPDHTGRGVPSSAMSDGRMKKLTANGFDHRLHTPMGGVW